MVTVASEARSGVQELVGATLREVDERGSSVVDALRRVFPTVKLSEEERDELAFHGALHRVHEAKAVRATTTVRREQEPGESPREFEARVLRAVTYDPGDGQRPLYDMTREDLEAVLGVLRRQEVGFKRRGDAVEGILGLLKRAGVSIVRELPAGKLRRAEELAREARL